jgi:hypothetical protein
MGSSWPSISQRRHDCGQHRRIDRARDPQPNPGRKLDLNRTAGRRGRRQRLAVWRNEDCRKAHFTILSRWRLIPAGEDSRARLPAKP